MQPEEHYDDPRFAVEIDAVRFDPKDDAPTAGRRAAAGTKRRATARDRRGTTTMHRVDRRGHRSGSRSCAAPPGYALLTNVELA
jgi:hypothetical protein